MNTRSVTLVGCGNMGSLLLKMLIEANLFFSVTVVEPDCSKESVLLKIGHDHTSQTIHFIDNQTSIKEKQDLIIFAIKPQIAPEIITNYKTLLKDDSIVVSVMAGKQISSIEAILRKGLKMVRVMPNIGAQINKSVNAIYAKGLSNEDVKLIDTLFAKIGINIFLDNEEMMHGATVIAGCAPGYIAKLSQILTEVTVSFGFDANLARNMVMSSLVCGTELLISNPTEKFEDTIKRVSSKGGVTEKIVESIEDIANDIKDVMREGYKRSKSLSND